MPDKLIGTWRLNYHVETVATLKPFQADVLLQGVREGDLDSWIMYEPRPLRVVIDYPIENPVELEISPKDYAPKGHSSIGLLMYIIAKEYEQIYKNPKKHEIWGHGIGDLYFERITVNKNGQVELAIGS